MTEALLSKDEVESRLIQLNTNERRKLLVSLGLSIPLDLMTLPELRSLHLREKHRLRRITGPTNEFSMSHCKISGYAVRWGSYDWLGVRIKPGAFTLGLEAHRANGSWPLMLWRHNDEEVIGVWDDIVEDLHGLYVSGRILPEVSCAADALVLIKNLALNGLSVGLKPMREEIDVFAPLDQPAGQIISAYLTEISVVSTPMFRDARISTIEEIAA